MNISGDPPKFFGGPPFGATLKNMGDPSFFGGPGGPQKILKLKETLGGPQENNLCAGVHPNASQALFIVYL